MDIDFNLIWNQNILSFKIVFITISVIAVLVIIGLIVRSLSKKSCDIKGNYYSTKYKRCLLSKTPYVDKCPAPENFYSIVNGECILKKDEIALEDSSYSSLKMTSRHL